MQSASIVEVIGRFSSRIIGETILESCCRRYSIERTHIRTEQQQKLLVALRRSVTLFVKGEEARTRCIRELEEILGDLDAVQETAEPQETVPISTEDDIVVARSAGRHVCGRIGFNLVSQAKVVTIISELARNIFQYAGTGEVEIGTVSQPRAGICIVARDQGPGIWDIDLILEGNYQSKTGMGKGLMAAKKMMDEFKIVSKVGQGTEIRVVKYVE